MLSDDIKPLVTEHMAEMTKIVSYFEFENKNNETTFDIDDSRIWLLTELQPEAGSSLE